MSTSAGSIPELPVSPGARVARIALVLLVDAAMLGVGVYLIHSYLGRRARARAAGDVVRVDEPRPADAAREVHEIRAAPAPLPPEQEAGDRQAGPDQPAGAPGRGPVAASRPSRSPPARRTPASPRRGDPPPPGAQQIDEAPRTAAGPDRGPEPGEGDSQAAREALGGPVPDEEVQKLAARVARVVDSEHAMLSRCYQRAAKGPGTAEPIEGRIDVRLTVHGDGNAANVRVESNDTGSDVLAACLVAAVESWSFPRHPYQPIEFVWPFAFHPPQDD